MIILESRKEHGAVFVDGKQVGYTLQCVHCGRHEEIHPGSGKKRGFCQYCKGGFVCGRPECMLHIPFDYKLEYAEAKAINDLRILRKLEKQFPEIGGIQI